ncbi:MAG: translocation/assembly module TamB domain-containing protein [Acidobacteriota bacterium]
MKKIVLRAGIVLGVLLLLVGGAVWWAVSTDAGARRVIALAGSAMKGSLSVESVEGPIRGPLTLRGLTWKTPALTVTIRTARLEWRLGALLRKRLDIVSLHAAGVRVRTAPAPEKKQREKLPDVHLPVNIVVREAVIEDIEMASEKPGPPFRLDSVTLATSVLGDTVRVDRLAVRGPSFSGDVAGTLRPQGDYPVDLSVRWAMQPAGMPRYSGEGRLTGTLERLVVTSRLSAPVSIDLGATLTAPMRDMRFSADVRFEELDVRRLKPDAPAAVVSGALHAEGTLAALTTTGQARVKTDVANLGRVDVAWDLSRRGEEIRVARLDLRLPEGSSARVSGTVVIANPDYRFDLAATWNRFVWPLRGPASVASSRGDLRIRGTAKDYALTANADVRGAGVPPGVWQLAGRGTAERLQIARLSGKVLGGTFAATGSVAWKPALSWNLALEGDGLNPGEMVKEAPGRLAFRARTRGRLERQGPAGDAEILELSGTLRGQPVSGAALAQFAGNRIVLPRASISVATAKLEASGRIADTWDLTWRAEAPNLSLLVGGVGGALSANGSLTGPRQTPRVRIVADGKSLARGERQIGRLRLEADIDFRSENPSRLDLRAQGVVAAPGRSADTVTLAGRGTLARHDLTLDVAAPGVTLSFAAAGGVEAAPRASRGASVSGRAWQGRITRLDVTSKAISGGLERPAAVAVSATAARLQDFSWSARSGGRLALAGVWAKAGPSEVHASIDALPLAILKPWLPADVVLTGNLNGKADAAVAAGGAVDAVVDLRPGPGEIQYTTASGERAAFPYRDANLRFRADSKGAAATVGLGIGSGGTLSGEVALPDYNARAVPSPAQRVTGRFSASLPDIAFARAFVSAVENLRGAFRADLAFDGTLGNPRIRGKAALTGAQADLPDYGLRLRDIAFSAASDGGPLLKLDGQVRSGEGTLTLTGQTPLQPSAENPANIHISGRRFAALATSDRKVWVSPDLTIVATADRISVTGDVRIPQTRIEYVRKFATIPVSPDVVFIGRSAEEEAAARRKATRVIEARVRLILGDQVNIKAEGFDGRITGSLLAIDAAGKPTSATGELVIASGTYKAYGQDLTVEHGRIVFAGGPIGNPAVDLRAFRKADDGTVAGVNVKGTVRNPEVTLYSEPPMGQTDALAYLLLGHPLGQASSQEGNLVANAATSLGIKGGNLLGKKIAARFGLETARIETRGGLQEASLVVGKYLSPKLYVEYGLGLFDPVSTLRIRYILSRKWSVSAETGAENAADLLYTIEAGKTPGGGR